MPLLFNYLFKISITITVIYLFYQLVLRRLTFYNWNRLYLLLYTFLAFFIPLIDISPVIEKDHVLPTNVIEFVPAVESFATQSGTTYSIGTVSQFGIWQMLQVIFVVGLLIFIIKLLFHFLSLVRLKSKSIRISENGIRIFQVNKNIVPFSFGDSIFINHQ